MRKIRLFVEQCRWFVRMRKNGKLSARQRWRDAGFVASTLLTEPTKEDIGWAIESVRRTDHISKNDR